MWMQWGQQRQYIMSSWNVGYFIGTLFVITNLLGQLIPCGMILARKKTDIACGILVFIIAFQVRLRIGCEHLTHRRLTRSSPWPTVLSGNLASCLGRIIITHRAIR